jgi:hypothetical protein
MTAARKNVTEAIEAWRALSPELRLRILSTTGGCSNDEYAVIEAGPKPSMVEYQRAQNTAAALLRAAAEPEAKAEPYGLCPKCGARGYYPTGVCGACGLGDDS